MKNIFIIIFLLIISCKSDTQIKDVLVNKTIKVFSEKFHNNAENYIFKWQYPVGPDNDNILFNLKDDMLIFTPKKLGLYKINLSIENIAGEIIEKEIFTFNAILDTANIAILNKKEKKIKDSSIKNKQKTNRNDQVKPQVKSNTTIKKKKVKVPHKNNKKANVNYLYALQISSWPSLEEARKHQLELIDLGFDAYTQRFYSKKKDAVWYRVRLGNYSTKKKALKIKEQIESSTGIITWLDILPIK